MTGAPSPMSYSSNTLKGIGIGLRASHVNEILKTKPNFDWLELLADNHIVDGGWLRKQALKAAELYPVTMHCVGMSIGSIDPVNQEYIVKIKELADEVKPQIISDHLCWSNYQSHFSHDLLPLPFTEEALVHVAKKVDSIQNLLNEQIAIENISYYASYKHSTIDEVEFLNAVAQRADCLILLDLNNLYVNHRNNFKSTHDAQYLERFIGLIDAQRIAEVHLAGFEDKGNYYLDSHNNSVHDHVWDLYRDFVKKVPNVPALIEWDHDIPTLHILYAEAKKAKSIYESKTQGEYDFAKVG